MFYSIYQINLENIAIAENSILEKQCSYMSESYINYIFNEFIKDNSQILDDINSNRYTFDSLELFPEFESSKNIELLRNSNNIPEITLLSHIEYEGIKTSFEGRISIFNDLFFYDKAIINKSSLNEKMLNDFEKLTNKYKSTETHISELDVLEIYNNRLLYYVYSFYLYDYMEILSCEDIVSGYYLTGYQNKYLYEKKLFLLDGNNYFGLSCLGSKGLNLKGVIINKGEIILDNDLNFEGIFISDGGSVNTNGNRFRIDGIFIELGSGSYPYMDCNYNIDNITPYLPNLPWAYDIELDLIKEVYKTIDI